MKLIGKKVCLWQFVIYFSICHQLIAVSVGVIDLTVLRG